MRKSVKGGLVYALRGVRYWNKLWVSTNFAGTDNLNKEDGVNKRYFLNMKDISEEELENAKVRVIGNKKIRSEESSNTAINLVFSELYSDARDYYEYEKEIMSVTLSDIRKITENVEFSSFILEPANLNF